MEKGEESLATRRKLFFLMVLFVGWVTLVFLSSMVRGYADDGIGTYVPALKFIINLFTALRICS